VRWSQRISLIVSTACKERPDLFLLRNKPSRKKTQVLKRLEQLNEPIYKAMLLKEQFATIYLLRNKKEAQPAQRAWIGESLHLSHLRGINNKTNG